MGRWTQSYDEDCCRLPEDVSQFIYDGESGTYTPGPKVRCNFEKHGSPPLPLPPPPPPSKHETRRRRDVMHPKLSLDMNFTSRRRMSSRDVLEPAFPSSAGSAEYVFIPSSSPSPHSPSSSASAPASSSSVSSDKPDHFHRGRSTSVVRTIAATSSLKNKALPPLPHSSPSSPSSSYFSSFPRPSKSPSRRRTTTQRIVNNNNNNNRTSSLLSPLSEIHLTNLSSPGPHSRHSGSAIMGSGVALMCPTNNDTKSRWRDPRGRRNRNNHNHNCSNRTRTRTRTRSTRSTRSSTRNNNNHHSSTSTTTTTTPDVMILYAATKKAAALPKMQGVVQSVMRGFRYLQI